MFDLVTGKARHLPRHATLPIIVSTAAQVVVVGAAIAIPVLLVTDTMPDVPTMMAFVAAPPPPPPPPPPPAPAQPKPAAARPTPAATSNIAAPIAPPTAIAAERPSGEGLDVGVPGGVEGGVPGGVIGGVVGGIPDVPAPPPPPAQKGPVRIGGQIQAPALVKRVEPSYPPIAVSAHIEGVVILEAVVDRDGSVAEVKVLRSLHPVLDREAMLTVKQWRYSPLVLNGTREPFVLTVVLSFHLEAAS